jgi:hypothetical protein
VFIERSVPKQGCTAQRNNFTKIPGLQQLIRAPLYRLATKKMMNDQIDMFQLVTSNALAEFKKKQKNKESVG